MTTTVTVNAADFCGALTDVARTAAATDVPVIEGVLAHTDKSGERQVLVLTSTDRFTIGQAHMSCEGDASDRFIPVGEVKRLLAVLKLYVKPETVLALRYTKAAITIAVGGLTVSVEAPEGRNQEFVKIAKVWNIAGVDGDPGNQATFNPKLVARFAAIATRRCERMNVRITAKNRAAYVQIGAQYQALIMPVREEPQQIAVFLPAAERAEIEAALKVAEQARKSVTTKRVAAKGPRKTAVAS